MARFEHSVEIARPPEAVFAFLTDPRNYPLWQPSLIEVRPHRRGRLRVGAEVTEVRRFLGHEMETTFVCTEHEPPRRSSIEDDSGPVPFRGTFELEPTRRGTRFRWTVETRPAPLSKLAGPLVGRVTERELATNATALKALLEGRADGARRGR